MNSNQAQSLAVFAKLLETIAKALAILSGLTLIGMALMSFVSVVGRWLLSRPILGDYEIVQVLCVIAVSLALPYTQWVRGHIIVDFFTAHLNARFNLCLDTLAAVLMCMASWLIAWRVWVGMWDIRMSFDSTMLLAIPTWWGYIPLAPSFFLLGLIVLYQAWSNLQQLHS